MRQTVLHLALILLAVIALTPADFLPEAAASMVAKLSAPGLPTSTVPSPGLPTSAVPTSSVPANTGIRKTPATLEDVVRDAGLPVVFVDIARCESGSDPTAVHLNRNGSRDHGLWQINDRWWRPLFETLNPYDPVENAAMAALVYAEQGLDAWEPSRPCWEPAMFPTKTVEPGKPR